MNIVIDTNVFISALIKDSSSRELIVNSENNLFFPEFEYDEIEKHKEEILRKSGLSEEDFRNLLSNLLKYVKIVKTEDIIDYKKQAFGIIGKIDENDVIFIATALAHNAAIWSEDKHFQKQNTIKILRTRDIINIYRTYGNRDWNNN
ncbi:DNA-binding protein [Candidatus Pacearchaeota archaeon CG10_big_fil_rev_8_21_14_0_10_34_12]|nr:MAG: DNA-binding protein [Candidatus Pacearchaeota archaeon CG10_big_fil_rev_8_21_14_0_10_34_12]